LSFIVNDYVVDSALLYGDVDYDRVSEADWIRYLNAAIRALILVRPDAGSTTSNVQLVAGVKQSIPADSLRLLDITRNMGDDGDTPGKIITPAKRQHIDYSNLLWPAATGDVAVDNFSYDRNAPTVFYVTPPVSDATDVYVEMITSKLPTTLAATDDSMEVNDLFFEPLVQYMLYKAFSADDEDVEFQKATQDLSNFFNLLQVEQAASNSNGPEVKE
jgi:hypothetical protein